MRACLLVLCILVAVSLCVDRRYILPNVQVDRNSLGNCTQACDLPVNFTTTVMGACQQNGVTVTPMSICSTSVTNFFCTINVLPARFSHGIQYPGPCGCPNYCSNSTERGTCNENTWTCECAKGFYGEDCSLVTTGNVCGYSGTVQKISDDDDDDSDSEIAHDTCVCSVSTLAGNTCTARVGHLPPIIQTIADTQYTSMDNYNNSHPIFNDTTIAQIHLTMNASTLNFMLDPVHQNATDYYPSEFWFYNGAIPKTYAQVGFRLKGGFSRNYVKKSWKLSFNKYKKGRDWAQQEKLELKAMVMDNSAIHEKLCLGLFYSMNAKIQRGSYAQLYINNQTMGMYIMLENIDKNFLNSRFGNDNGQLYKCTGTLAYLGNDTDSYTSYYEAETDAASDYTNLINFIEIINYAPNSTFVQQIEAVFDTDLFIRTLVAEVLTGNMDGIWNANNYFLYFNYEIGKFQYFRHDLDISFGLWDTYYNMTLRDVYHWGDGGRGHILIDRILGVPQYQASYTQYLLKFMANYFSLQGTLVPRAEFLTSEIASGIRQDWWHQMDYGWTFEESQGALGNGVTRPIGGLWGKHFNTTTVFTYAIMDFLDKRIASANSQINNWISINHPTTTAQQ